MKALVVGGGMMGLCTAMLLANDGHEVTVLERDEHGPPDPAAAFESWERRGVNQFRMAHFFLSRFREMLECELPQLRDGLAGAGAISYNVLANIPDELKGGPRADDDRFDTITGRRPVVESVTAQLCAETKNVSIRRGSTVQALLAGSSNHKGVPHVTGVKLDSDEAITADLVIDASGRRSALPRWLTAIGAAPIVEEQEDSGFVYYGRHFRSADGQMPVMLGPLKQDLGSIGILTLPADNGTWSVTLTASSKDAELRALRHPKTWERVNRMLPLTAHWIDAEPLDESVVVMAKIEDRIRDFAPGGNPVATGVVAVADSWSCTNPSLGRGASIGLLHTLTLPRPPPAAGRPLGSRDRVVPGNPRDARTVVPHHEGLRQPPVAGDTSRDRRSPLCDRRRVLASQPRPRGCCPRGRGQHTRRARHGDGAPSSRRGAGRPGAPRADPGSDGIGCRRLGSGARP